MSKLLARDFIKNKKIPLVVCKCVIDAAYEYHSHEFFEFFFISEGKFLHTLNGEERTVFQGDIVLMNPQQKHSFRPLQDGKAETLQVMFMPSFVDVDVKLLKENKGFVEFVYMEPFYNEGLKIFHLSGVRELKVKNLLNEMLSEYEKKPKGFEVALKTKLLELLIALVRIYEEEKATPEKVRLSKKAATITESLEYIEAHFKEPLKLEDISLNKAGLTKEYYCTIFKKITGRTFTEYITQLRIKEAQRLLIKENAPVTEACYESGFNDLSHFIKTFKKETGYNPTGYTKKFKKK